MSTTHYVVEVETTTPAMTDNLDDVDVWVERLTPWHGGISTSQAGKLVLILTVPAETLAQAVATTLAVAAQWAEPLGVQALPEQVRDGREGWAPVPELLSVSQAAERLGVSRQRVLQMIDEGKLPAQKVGTTNVIPAGAVPAPPAD